MDEEIYVFRIDAFTPETIPMARLAEYLANLASMLGEKERVHFRSIEPGSARVVSVVERSAAPKVRDNLLTAPSGDQSPSSEAFRKLNDMLRRDNAEGALCRGTAQILAFPGRRMQRPPRIGPFNQTIFKDGVLVRVGGKDKSAHATIEDSMGQTWSFEVTRDMARELAHHLFEKPLRLFGQGRWTRNEEGEWEHSSLKALSFEVLKDTPLVGVLSEFRSREKRSDTGRKSTAALRKLRDEEEDL